MKDEPLKWKDENPVAGMTPYLFEYDGPDGAYGITLYGTDPDQILEDNCGELNGLRYCGVLIATAPDNPSKKS